METRPLPVRGMPTVLPSSLASAEHPGGCYTCRYFRARRGPAVLCGHDSGHVHSLPARGCAFWEREPGADG